MDDETGRVAFCYMIFVILIMMGLCPFLAMLWRTTDLRPGLQECGCRSCVPCCDRCWGDTPQYDPRDLQVIQELEEGTFAQREVRTRYTLYRSASMPRHILRLSSWREDVKNTSAHDLKASHLKRLQSLSIGNDDEEHVERLEVPAPPVHGIGATATAGSSSPSNSSVERSPVQSTEQEVVDVV